MCCDTVNRGVAYADGKIFLHQADTTLVALDAKTGKVVWSVKNGDPSRARPAPRRRTCSRTRSIIGISGGEFGVRGSVTAYNIKDGKLAGGAISMGPDSDTLIDPVRRPPQLGKPVGPDSSTQHLARRSVEDRRRRHVGLVLLRSRAEPDLLRFGQSLDLESEAASRRQQMVDDHLGTRVRHRHGQVGLSDDAARRVGLRRRQRDDPHRPDDQRQAAQAADALRSQRSRLYARSRRPANCWSPRSTIRRSTGPPASTWTRTRRTTGDRRSSSQYSTDQNGEDHEQEGHLPGGTRHEG